MKKAISLFYFVLIFVVMVSVSCTTQVNNATPDFEVMGSPSATITPIVIPSPLATITLTVLPPTLTPLPTLNSKQALAKIRELFQTNGSCKLPCWWGIKTGFSRSSDAYNLIHSIGQDYEYNISDDKKSEAVFFHYFDLPEDMRYSPNDYFEGQIYAENGIVTRIVVSGFDWPSYHLSTFLLENGKPDEVWINTYRLSDPNLTVPFGVSLLYSEEGVLVSYGTWLGEQKGENIIGCIDISPNLSIWAPDKHLSFAEAKALINNEFSPDYYKPIAEATSGKLDVEQFYEQYKNSAETPCIETNAGLWVLER